MSNEYYEKTKEQSPTESLVRAVKILNKKGEALDLGVGAGRDSRFLVQAGFYVNAVDASEEAAKYLADIPQTSFRFHNEDIRRFEFGSEKYDIINAQRSLFFLSKVEISQIFSHLKDSLKHGGILAAQLLGDKDEGRIGRHPLSMFSKEEILELLSGFEILEINESEYDAPLASGTVKHWDSFDVIVRKQ